MSTKKSHISEKNFRQSVADLTLLLQDIDTIYCIVRHVARLGMRWYLTPIIFKPGSTP